MSDAQCEGFCELISAFVDERLDREELLRLEEHFLACADCRAFDGGLRRNRALLQAAEAFRPLRRPPPGFAALVAARVGSEPRAAVVPFPEVAAARSRPRASWVGLIAAAAAVLFFAWSWQRVLPVNSLEQKTVTSRVAPKVEAADRGSMDTWVREHAVFAGGGTILGSAEETGFAGIHSGAGPER